MIIPIILFIVGLALIIKGGDYFVDAARWFSDITGIPRFIVGATVVSVATTLPELLVSLFATLEGSIDLAVGNAIGSVIANIALIMAISIIAMPAKLEGSDFFNKGVLMIVATLMLGALLLDGNLGPIDSLLLFSIFGIFVFENIISAKKMQSGSGDERPKATSQDFFINTVKFIAGLAGIILGSDMIVDNATIIAEGFNVSPAIIGLTIVAVGTSLPELITTITAITKRESSLSVGNIIGANIIDMTMILAICAVVRAGGVTVSRTTLTTDLPMALLVMATAVIPPMFTRRLMRWQGFVMLAIYILYVTRMILA